MKVFGCVAALLLLLLLSPPSASSQTSLGFQAGLSMATLGGDDVENDPDYRMGFGIGALVDFSLSDIISIQPEVSYMQKGAKESEDGVDIKLKLDYVEIPLLFKFKVPTEGSVDPYLMVGPVVGFKAGCKIGGEEGGASVEIDCEDAEMEITSVDFGGAIAAGLGFEAGPGQMFFGARYYLGFTSIDDSSDAEDIKNQGFFFSAGYSFPIGG